MKKILFFLAFCSVALSQSPNFFYTYLTSGISATDTLVTFTATDTSYSSADTNFYATIFDSRYSDAADAYKAGRAEIVLVNSRSANVFNIERAQLGTTARAFNTSGRRYKLVASVYSQNIAPPIGASDSGKVLSNNGENLAWGNAGTPEYVARISFHASAPVINSVLKNTISGSPSATFARTGTGTFTITFPDNTFDADKVTLNRVVNNVNGNLTDEYEAGVAWIYIQGSGANSWGLYLLDINGDSFDPAGYLEYVIEIRDYR